MWAWRMIAVTQLAGGALAQSPYPDVLYYKFDEGSGTQTANVAVPSAGSALATVNGHTLVPTGGQFQGALASNGTSLAHVDTGWQTQLSGEFTISFWLDLTSVATTNPFMYVLGDSSASSFRAFTNGAAGTGNIVLRSTLWSTGLVLPGGALQTGPHHLAWVYRSSTAELRGFVDGALVASAPVTVATHSGTSTFRVGAYSTASPMLSGARMDEFRLYSTALTDSEIAATWNASLSNNPGGVVYCTAGTTTNGCVPSISGSGTPSASAASGYTIDVAALEGQKQGLVFYGINNTGFAPLAWGPSSSFLCVKPPTQRTLAQSTGGTPGQCDGALALDWNAFRATNPGALGQPFAAGQKFYAQAWFRDPPSPNTTMLSDALEFTVAP